jgi:hypothetical protein
VTTISNINSVCWMYTNAFFRIRPSSSHFEMRGESGFPNLTSMCGSRRSTRGLFQIRSPASSSKNDILCSPEMVLYRRSPPL